MDDYPETVRALSQSTIQALRDEGFLDRPARHSYLRLSIATAAILLATAFLIKNITSADIVIIGFILLLALIIRTVYFIVSCLASIALWLIILTIVLTPLFAVYLFFAGFI